MYSKESTYKELNATVDQVRGVLSAHAEKQVSGPDRLVYVSREKVYATLLSYFEEDKFRKDKGYINVCFVSSEEKDKEEAVDLGMYCIPLGIRKCWA